jgi:hypothetical protein
MKDLLKVLLRENILSEIDWQGKFGDVSKKPMTIDQTKEYLAKVVGNCKLKPADREATALDKPYIHAKKIQQDESGEIDIDSFIADITKMPKDILSVNSKMEKSSSENSISVNIGIPALRGLVYDIDEKLFYIVNTCPGAGSCALICYARRGSYVMFPDVFVKQTRILNLLLNFPDRFEKLLLRELESFALKNPDKEIQMRWNDAGDFFTGEYYEIATRITKQLKSEGYNIKSYGYTKMGDVINLADPDVTINFSDDANKRETEKVKDLKGAKKSVIVAKNVFDDLLVKDAKNRNYETNEKGKVMFKNGQNGVNELKQRLAKLYDVDVSTIVTYDELLKIPQGGDLIYSVIVMPKGDGDVGAQRNDVRTSFLLFH